MCERMCPCGANPEPAPRGFLWTSESISANWPRGVYEVIPGRCPNAGHPCNCIGACLPRLVPVAPKEQP